MRRTRSALLAAACALGLILPASTLAAEKFTKAAKITLDKAGVLEVDGKKVFPITLTIVPEPDAKAPDGRHAYEKFADDGAMFMRSGKPNWNEETLAFEKKMQAAAAEHGMRCCPWLGWDLALVGPEDKKQEQKLIEVINMFKDSPGMGLWKGADEPDWGNSHDAKKHTPEEVIHTAKIIRAHDPNHPIWLVQAPRGTVQSMRRYQDGWDVGGIDIYPISYPPGVHTVLPNKGLSMTGDFTRMMKQVAGDKPFWMTLQIAFSGVVKPERTLRFPTFPEQRFMAYESIINGARGLVYFGGGLPQTHNDRDKPLGYNWTYWDKVMVPLLQEVGPKSPILPALLAPDSKVKLSVKLENPPKRAVATKAEEVAKDPNAPKNFVQDEVEGSAAQIECLVRESGKDLYVLACCKEGPTVRVRFSGLPTDCTTATVVFEEPRKVTAENGSFADWFGPNEVHVYKFTRK